jgi:molecular chaperone GrpE
LSGGRRHRHEEDTAALAAAASSPVPAEPGPGQLEPVETDLQEELDGLRRERDELKDQLLRRRAEFENFRKRVERDRQLASVEAAATVFRDLVPTLDNLERALRAEGDDDVLRKGVELTRRDLLAMLESHGVVEHDPVGEAFDPTLHQALVHEPVAGLEEGRIAEVFRKGYSFRDRLLRPALVRVAKGSEAGGGASEDGNTD